MSISFHDVERLQAFYPDHKIELREGKLIIMSPSDFASSEIGARFIGFLSAWVYKQNAGRIAKSSTDRIRELEEKIALFLRQGVQVSLLIDPDKRTVRTYRSSSLRKDAEGEEVIFPITILQDGDTLTIPDLFPGWELPITSLWPPVYE